MIKIKRIIIFICIIIDIFLIVNWIHTNHITTVQITYYESHIADKIHNEESFMPKTIGNETLYEQQIHHHEEEFIFVIYSKEIDELNKVYVDKDTYNKYEIYNKYPYTETKMKFVW